MMKPLPHARVWRLPALNLVCTNQKSTKVTAATLFRRTARDDVHTSEELHRDGNGIEAEPLSLLKGAKVWKQRRVWHGPYCFDSAYQTPGQTDSEDIPGAWSGDM